MQIPGKLTTLMLAGILLTAAGCKKSQNPASARTDQQMTNDLQTKLASESMLQGQSINPVVAKGVATLNGTVSTYDARTLAGSDAGSIDGIRTVVNDLVVPSDQAELCNPAPPVRVHHHVRHIRRQPVMTASAPEPLPPAPQPPQVVRTVVVRPVPVVVAPPPPVFFAGPGYYPYRRVWGWRRPWVRPGPPVIYARPY
jgi:hypothetical protein